MSFGQLTERILEEREKEVNPKPNLALVLNFGIQAVVKWGVLYNCRIICPAFFPFRRLHNILLMDQGYVALKIFAACNFKENSSFCSKTNGIFAKEKCF